MKQVLFHIFHLNSREKIEYYIQWIQLPRLQTITLNEIYALHSNLEGKIHFRKKPAAGAARTGILYRSQPP